GGWNRVIVKELDASNKEVGRTFVDIWYSNGAGVTISSNIAASTTWLAANGPYRVTANVAVSSGATLTIQPGTTVYFSPNARLTINTGAVLNAIGSDPAGNHTSGHIRFTHDPSSSNTNTATWGGVTF